MIVKKMSLNFYLSLILLICINLACNDKVSNSSQTLDEEKRFQMQNGIENSLLQIPEPISENPAMKSGEKTFIELSNKIPRFAGFYLNRGQSISMNDDKIVVLFKGNEKATQSLNKVISKLNQKI